MFASILSAIAAIPALLKSIQDLLAYFDKLDKAGFFEANAKLQQEIKASQTEEERKATAKGINDLLKKL